MSPFLDTPERVAFAGDWHGRTHPALDALSYAASLGATHVVHAGDFGFNFADAYLDALEEACRRLGLCVGFVDGNHEDHPWLSAQPVGADGLRALRPHIAHLPRGFRWSWSGMSFMALGGAHSVDRQARIPGVSWWPGETLSLGDAYRALQHGPVDVVVAHDVPAGVLGLALGNNSRFPRSEVELAGEHRELVRQVADSLRPRAWWHGHYHFRYDGVLRGPGYRTWVHGLAHDGAAVDENIVVVPLEDAVAQAPHR